MKICWDNLNKAILTKKGKFKISNIYYVYDEYCAGCGEPYLRRSTSPEELFCSISCSRSGKNNPMYGKTGKCNPNYGKKRSLEARKKMSLSAMGRKLSDETKLKVSKASRGRKHNKETIIKMSKVKKGKKRLPEHIENMKKSAKNGSASPLWKGGVRDKQIPLYDTYAHQIDYADDIREYIDKNGLKLLQVKCTYCGKWFVPSVGSVQHRASSLLGKSSGEKRLYCSNGCKMSCPTFNRKKYPKGFNKATSREVNPIIRQMCFERDNWACIKCGMTTALHCHHILSYKQNTMLANDIDNCITVCQPCHMEIHSQDGCKFYQLTCDYMKEK